MPTLVPEKRGAGPQFPRHYNHLPPLAVPDQARYGPPGPKHDPEHPIAFTEEAGGVVATCTICGWLRYVETAQDADRVSAVHKCRSDDRCLICGPPVRLKDDDCTHRLTKGAAQ